MTSAAIPLTAGSPVIISGPTGSGKTFFVHKLLKYDMFTEQISTILYCYGVYQDYYDNHYQILFFMKEFLKKNKLEN